MDEFSDEATYLAIGAVSQPLDLANPIVAIDLIKLLFYPERQVFTYKETALSLVNSMTSHMK